MNGPGITASSQDFYWGGGCSSHDSLLRGNKCGASESVWTPGLWVSVEVHDCLLRGVKKKKRKSWRHRLATHGRWSDVVITGLPVRHVARAVQPNVKSSASIFSLECWEKAGEFSLICKLFLENQSADGFQSFHMLMRAMVNKRTARERDRGHSHLSRNWTLRVKCVWEQ